MRPHTVLFPADRVFAFFAKPFSTWYGSHPNLTHRCFIFRQNPRQLLPEAAHLGFLNPETGDVSLDKAHGATDDAVDPMGNESLPVIDPELSRERSVDPEEVHKRMGAAAVVRVSESRIGHGLHRRDQYGHVLGTATGHHAVDGNVPGCCPEVRDRKHRYLLIGRIIGIF